MKRRAFLCVLVLGVALTFPESARADAGTPLMWAEILHLLIGNFLIGIGEGLLLTWLFSAPSRRTILVMIVANYFSAWVGCFLMQGPLLSALPMDLNNGWRWFWTMVVASYFMTVVLEWPFIAFCLRGKQNWLKRSIRASLIVQAASYVLLFGWYGMATRTSLYTQMNIVAPAAMDLPKSVQIYFISSTDGNVHRRKLACGEEKIFELNSTEIVDRLFVRPNLQDTNHWDLMARIGTADERASRIVEVVTNMVADVALERHSVVDRSSYDYEGPRGNSGIELAFGSPAKNRWTFWCSFWAGGGLRAEENSTSETVRFAYETPFGQWAVRDVVHLPNDTALFQLGNDQICAFDPATKRVTLLWHGRGPVAVIEKGN